MKTNPHHRQGGFSIVETLMGAAAATIVGIGIFTVLNTGMMLSARNLSLNATNNALRGSLDRAEHLLQHADSMPTLIDTAGNAVAGPAAGIRFDLFVGAPYVLSVPVTGLPATTTVLSLQRSIDPLASPPVPTVGDIVVIDGEASTLRPRVTAVTTGVADALLHQPLTTTLAAPLGTAVSGSSTTLTAKLVRNVALIVMLNGGKRELRYYPAFDLTSNLNDPTQYTVLTDQVGMQPDDATPFTIIQNQTKNFVNMSFRVRANRFDERLQGKQSDQFNTFARVDVQIRPKVNP
jgi:hypothetical protein